MDWLFENKEWIFSGIGASIISILVAIFLKNKSSQQQSSGSKSVNLQSGRDINVGRQPDDK